MSLDPTRAPSPTLEPPQDVRDLVHSQPALAVVAEALMRTRSQRGVRGLQILARCRQLRPAQDAVARNPQRTAAFFDLDGTVLRGSIIGHMTRQAIAEGHGRLLPMIQFGVCFALYKLNLVPRLTMYRWGYAPCAGQDISMVSGIVDRCLAQRIKPRIFREAREAVAAHRAAGHLCVAITGAPDYAAAELCDELGMDDLLATPTPLSPQGHITCDVQEPVCYGDGKLAYLRAYAAKNAVDLASSYFYSDSASDKPVLKAVGRPRVVNPQWLLLPWALRQGIPVARWSRQDVGGVPVTGTSRALVGAAADPL